MEVQKDFRDLLELFNKNKVEYTIVGAYALAYHGARISHETGIRVNDQGPIFIYNFVDRLT
jgi:hypothetical protein